MVTRSGRNYKALVQYVPRGQRSSGLNWRAGLRSAAAVAGRYVGSRIGSYLSGPQSVESRAISTQHDMAMRYRKKRMPARRRRRWVKFVRRVRAVELAAQPLQVYGFSRADLLTGLVNVQNAYGVMMGGTTVTNNDELYQIFQQAYNTATVADAADNIIYLKSISLDVQITNTGAQGMILDVYTILCRKSFTAAVTPGTQWTSALTELASPSGGGSITTSSPSLTAFDAPNFCSYWKILSKKEILIGSQQTTTMQLRNAKNKRIDGKILTTSPQAIPGYTMGYLYHIRGCPELNAGATRYSATSFSITYQINVKYAIPPGKTQEAGRT